MISQRAEELLLLLCALSKCENEKAEGEKARAALQPGEWKIVAEWALLLL